MTEKAIKCSQCGWNFNPFLNLTKEDSINYQNNLNKARIAWKIRNSDKIPLLKRDVFETEDEFKKRIEENNPYLVGTAVLLKNKYDVNEAIFPLKVRWKTWLTEKVNGLYIEAERDFAQALYQENHAYPVVAHLMIKESRVIILTLHLQGSKQRILINQYEDEKKWQWACRNDTIAAYEQYLMRYTLCNHRLEARQYIKEIRLAEKRKDFYILMGYMTMVMIGTIAGTIVAVTRQPTLENGLLGGGLGAVATLTSIFLGFVIFSTKTYREQSTLFAFEMFNGKKICANTITVNKKRESVITIEGWAVDEQAQKEARKVFLTVNGRDIPTFYYVERPDIARYLRNENYRFSGFFVSLNTTLLSRGSHTFALKIVAADNKSYYLPTEKLTVLIQ